MKNIQVYDQPLKVTALAELVSSSSHDRFSALDLTVGTRQEGER